jgi:predicted amidohydrolase YtcJ
MRLASLAVCAAILFANCAGQPAQEPATLVLRGGNIVTVNEGQPRAQALAARGNRIVAIGTDAEIAPLIGPSTEIIDLAGETAVPGFIEGHGHFMGLGQARMVIDLMDTTSFAQIVAKVAEAAKTAKPGDWILGRGWHQEKWTSAPTPNVEGFPYHDALSQAAPNNPVLLEHASGHAAFANARAMEAAGVTSKTPNPPGGDILKDPAGRPIGIFRETASGLIEKALDAWQAAKTPEQQAADARRAIALATEEAFSKGVTSFQDAGANFETVALYKQIAGEGQLAIRLWVMVRDSNERLRERLPQEKVTGMADHHLTVSAIKVTADGALGSRGAWLLDPYSDSPGSTGLNTTPLASIEETARIAVENGVQLGIHAIGDRANREVLNVYEATFKANPEKKDLRWRIEHAQHISAADIPRFGSLGVVASMQGIHCTSDAPYVLARLGPTRAAEGAYAWQALMKSGAIVSNGTDTPVERIDPIANYYATVTRKTKDGTVFYGDQKMSRDDALKSYTWNAAYAAKEDTLKGSLAVGKLADITVLSKDILTIADDEILTTKVTRTIVGGKVVYGQ